MSEPNPLQNLPAQLVALLLGWVFTLYLQHKSNIRAEAIRRKDKIIDKIDKIVDWVEKQTSDDDIDNSHIEAGFTALISHVEIRTNQLNSLVKQEVISSTNIAKLREIDIYSGDRKDLQHKVREAASDLIEELELACSTLYFDKKTWRDKLNYFWLEFAGITTALLCLVAAGILGLVITKINN